MNSHLEAKPANAAAEIRHALRGGGSATHAARSQQFFKEPIQSQGWRTADLRRAMRSYHRAILREKDFNFLLNVADQLFSGSVLEEKIAAVFLLEGMDKQFRDSDFRLFEAWLNRVTNWSDHDALVHDVIAPMVMAKPLRAKAALRWAKSADRWHRRAACVALIRGSRKKMFFPEIIEVSNTLLGDEDHMVQKGLGWLLRETAKHNPKRTVTYLMKIRDRAPRLVLRTACETLPLHKTQKVMEQKRSRPQK
jgi:3-methyladenine DNA glycosylase AlkD